MKIYWHIFVVVIALLKGNLCVPAIRPISQRGVIYPVENWDDCFLDDASTIKGVCKRLEDCPEIVKKWDNDKMYPKTCYFIKKEQFVCCPPSSSTSSLAPPPTPSATPSPTPAPTPTPTPSPTPSPTPTQSPLDMPQNQTSPTVKDNLDNIFSKDKDGFTEIVQRRSELECELHQTVESTVVNGLPTKPNEFPFMAVLGWTSNIDINKIWYRCGGVLISSKFVLTAAHCVEIGGAFPTVVHIGGSNLTESNVKNVKIKRFIKHPGYNVTSIYNDIALVELDQEVNNTMACLWTTHDLQKSNVTALGYGHTRFGGLASDQLLKAPLNAVPTAECEKYYQLDATLAPMGITDSHLCAGDPDHLRDTCQGDSGGPLIMEIFRTSYVVGVTSFGLGCAGEPPSIYTRVSSYINWIENVVWPNIDAVLGWLSTTSDNEIWYNCGGALISPKFVLTSAHCVEMGGMLPTWVHVGNSNPNGSNAENFKIKRFIKHPGYERLSIDNDIALIELEEEVNNTFACLWTTQDLKNTSFTALDYDGLISHQLFKSPPLNAVPTAECKKYYQNAAALAPEEISDAHFCAGAADPLTDNCNLETNGPLLMESSQTFYVVGVTSVRLCWFSELPRIYTRVSSFIDWIEDIVWPNINVRFDRK